jgi:serine/threonine protein kinase
MIESGTLLQNRYRVVKQIGQGGMGAVYVATDERFSSTVAVKQTFFDDPTLSRAFEREAHLLNHLRHTALPKVSDHFTEGDGQFLVMEFIEGSDLSELLQQRNGSAFPVADVLAWADALLDALDYLHTHEPQVVHRDIKPQNLKLTPRGQIVLLDFGLAKGNSTQTRANLTASVFGYSRSYAPLEQIQGTGTDTRSDLYSLAATLYHLLTGTVPVDALTRASAIINSQPDPLRPAHLAHAQVPAAVGEILRRAMSQNAAHRQTTAAEMRAALRRAASALPAHARQATPILAPQAKQATDMPTVLETPSPATYKQQPSPTMSDTRATTQLRQQQPQQQPATHQSETTIVDGGAYGARPRPSMNSFVPHAEPERKSKAVLIGVAVAVLVACALIAFPLMRRSDSTIALPAASDAQTGTPLDASTGAQQSAPDTSPSDGTRATTDTSSASQMTPSQTQTGGARPTDESQTANGQAANREAGATNGSDANAGGSNTGSGEANTTSPVAGASGSRSDGLVIHAPAPSSTSNAAAEYDAQRAEELKRRQQQQLQQQQQQRHLPPPPDEERFGPPPPGGGHRPPPRRPPPF